MRLAPLLSIAALSARFDPIGLDGLGGAALMDRTDTKFVVPTDVVPELLGRLVGGYRILDVEGVRLASYRSRYFDTPDLALYHAHHRRIAPRFKVRVRSYLESDLHFLEVKRKTNKGRTEKTRLPLPSRSADPLEVLGAEEIFASAGVAPVRSLRLSEAMMADFTRMTLVAREAPERLTIDVGLRIARGRETLAFPRMAVVEVKQTRRERSPALDALRSLHLREGAISKYCLGIAHLVPEAKTNRFKPMLHRLGRMAGGVALAVPS